MALSSVGGPSTLEKVTTQLYEEIRAGRWPVGTKLPGELVLTRELGVSRPLIREAIQGLARLGVLETRHGIGSFVLSAANPAELLSGLRRADVREIFEVQMAYDVEAAGLAAARRTSEDLVELEHAIARRNEAESDRSDPDRFAAEDGAFHLAIVVAAKNPVLLELYRYFLDRLRDGLHQVHADLDIPTCGEAAHREILDAVRDRDVERARESAYALVGNALASLDVDRAQDPATGAPTVLPPESDSRPDLL